MSSTPIAGRALAGTAARILATAVMLVAVLLGTAVISAPTAAATDYGVTDLTPVDRDSRAANQDYTFTTRGYTGRIKATLKVQITRPDGTKQWRTYRFATTAGTHRITVPAGAEGTDFLGCLGMMLTVTDRHGKHPYTVVGFGNFASADPVNDHVIVVS